MVVMRGRAAGSSSIGEGSGSGSGVGQLDDETRGFISAEIMRNIREQTPFIFGSVKEGILEILDDRLSAFLAEVVALVGAHAQTFKEF